VVRNVRAGSRQFAAAPHYDAFEQPDGQMGGMEGVRTDEDFGGRVRGGQVLTFAGEQDALADGIFRRFLRL
jgi:hypothetical protein